MCCALEKMRVFLAMKLIYLCELLTVYRSVQIVFFLLQLYEISDDPQRKEFLDDLFSFMQKRGKFSAKA